MRCEAVKQHKWLQRFVGEWTYTGQCAGESGGAPMTFEGVERVRAIGELWIVGESSGQMPGGAPATMILTVGFDPKKGRFVGSWIGSMMTHMWVYSGELDASERVLTLETEGACMKDPEKVRKYRDITEWVSDDRRAFRAMMLGDDGKWQQFMSMEMRRVGS